MLVGDFNAEESEPYLSRFLYEYNAKNIVKENTCFKNVLNPSYIDLFITNSPLTFQNTIAISNGFSDFHKMIIAVMKMSFRKHSPKEIHYRNYKYFDQTKFKNNLNEKFNEGISNYESFKTTFIEVLDTHLPLRKKFFRANHAPYITRTFRKVIMCRSQLETKYLKTKTQTDLKLYKKQTNFCGKLYKRESRKYYESLDMKKLLNSPEIWKTMKPFLSDKNTIFSQISIEKNKRIISDDLDLSEEFSTFFEDAFRSLSVKPDEYYLSDTENLSDTVEIAIRKFEKLPTVQAIKQNISVNQNFYFSNIEVSDILKKITALNNKKNGIFGNILTKRLKEVSDICTPP